MTRMMSRCRQSAVGRCLGRLHCMRDDGVWLWQGEQDDEDMRAMSGATHSQPSGKKPVRPKRRRTTSFVLPLADAQPPIGEHAIYLYKHGSIFSEHLVSIDIILQTDIMKRACANEGPIRHPPSAPTPMSAGVENAKGKAMSISRFESTTQAHGHNAKDASQQRLNHDDTLFIWYWLFFQISLCAFLQRDLCLRRSTDRPLHGRK